jgi:hypothetical protein
LSFFIATSFVFFAFPLFAVGADTHMRLLRDKQPIKRRESFSFGIGAEFRKMMNIFKQFHNGDGL